jgi:hypothetical protein
MSHDKMVEAPGNYFSILGIFVHYFIVIKCSKNHPYCTNYALNKFNFVSLLNKNGGGAGSIQILLVLQDVN